eukprot:761132-Hanusia_phi.AAC.2
MVQHRQAGPGCSGTLPPQTRHCGQAAAVTCVVPWHYCVSIGHGRAPALPWHVEVQALIAWPRAAGTVTVPVLVPGLGP